MVAAGAVKEFDAIYSISADLYSLLCLAIVVTAVIECRIGKWISVIIRPAPFLPSHRTAFVSHAAFRAFECLGQGFVLCNAIPLASAFGSVWTETRLYRLIVCPVSHILTIAITYEQHLRRSCHTPTPESSHSSLLPSFSASPVPSLLPH